MKRIVVGAIIGLAVGLVMTMPIVLDSDLILGSFYTMIHRPDEWIVMAWNSLGLPPQGCDAFAILYFIPGVQWTLTGTMLGLGLHLINRRKEKHPTKDSTVPPEGAPSDVR